MVAGNRLSQRDDAGRGAGSYSGMAPGESGVSYTVQPVEPSMPPLPSAQAVPATAYASAGAIGWAGAERMAGAAPRPALEGAPHHAGPGPLQPERAAAGHRRWWFRPRTRGVDRGR